jgi:hypothetical protein
MAAAVTLSIVGVSYSALNPDRLEAQARTVAATASCRTVDEAIVAFVGTNSRQPASITELVPYVKGDITAYSIVKGVAAGPGC